VEAGKMVHVCKPSVVENSCKDNDRISEQFQGEKKSIPELPEALTTMLKQMKVLGMQH
jgi:hypothetical protein